MKNGCLFWWKPKQNRGVFDEYDNQIEDAKQRLLAEVEEAIGRGAKRQVIYDELSRSDPSKMGSTDHIAFRHAQSHVQKQILSVMVDRNLKGKEMVAQGNIDAAISLYEANVADGFRGGHPYSELWVIYEQREDYRNAARVCQAFLDLPYDIKNRKEFQSRLIEFQKKIAQ